MPAKIEIESVCERERERWKAGGKEGERQVAGEGAQQVAVMAACSCCLCSLHL